MAAFTTIAAATVAVGGQAAKGFLAGDAAKSAAREAGRLELKKEQLEQESIAALEQNFYDAVRATTDVYDKALQLSNVQGRQLVEAAQEGDQRGVAATAGKIKAIQDIGTGKIADKQAMQKLAIDMARAKAGEASAEDIAALKDDRAAAAGVEAAAKRAEADKLEGVANNAFVNAGVEALKYGIGAFGNAEGKAVEGLMAKDPNLTQDAALEMLKGGTFSNQQLRQIGKGNFNIGEGGGINVLPKATDGLFGKDGALFGSEGFFGKDGALRGDDGVLDDIGGFLGIGQDNQEGVFGSDGFFAELFQSLGLSKPSSSAGPNPGGGV